MVGAPAIRWVVALKSEAKPIIEELQMLPMEKGIDFPSYSDRNRWHWLIISGVGQSRSTAATNYLHRESDAPPWSAWINIGFQYPIFHFGHPKNFCLTNAGQDSDQTLGV